MKSAVQRLGVLVGAASVLAAVSGRAEAAPAAPEAAQELRSMPPAAQVMAAEPPGVSAAGSDAPAPPPAFLGVMADAGLPDGANGSLVLRPASWIRLHAGGGTNTVSAGYRAGVTLMLPAIVSPSLSLDVGNYREGSANKIVRTFVGGEGALKPLFERLGYTYINTQLGLEFGRAPVQFFIHAGLSRITATIHNATAALEQARASSGTSDSSISVVVRQDPQVRVWAPSMKLGLLVYFGAGE
jgi:hypothetical protein